MLVIALLRYLPALFQISSYDTATGSVHSIWLMAIYHCWKYCIPYLRERIGSEISCALSITHQPEGNPIPVWGNQGCCDETAGCCCNDGVNNWWLDRQGDSELCNSYSSSHHRWLATEGLCFADKDNEWKSQWRKFGTAARGSHLGMEYQKAWIKWVSAYPHHNNQCLKHGVRCAKGAKFLTYLGAQNNP